MSIKEFDVDGFDEDLKLLGINTKNNPIEKLLAVADVGHRWGDEFLANATYRAKKAYLRKLCQRGYTDPDTGEHIHILGIEEYSVEAGQEVKGYKQLQFFTADNYEWVIRKNRDSMRHLRKKERWLCQQAAYAGFREELQRRFEFKLPFPKSEPSAS